MGRRASVVCAWFGFLLLVFLHLDFWRTQRVELYFGWMPEELLYRLAWIFLAWLYLLFVCGCVWRDASGAPDEAEEDR